MDQHSSHRGRMYALPLKITLPPSKAVTVDIRQELGRGVCGVVLEALIDGRQCALKLVCTSFLPEPHFRPICLADSLMESFCYQFQIRNLKKKKLTSHSIMTNPHLFANTAPMPPSPRLRLSILKQPPLSELSTGFLNYSLARHKYIHEVYALNISAAHP